MPLIVPCLDVTVGMRLAEAFTLRGRVMLPGGKTLTSEDVDILHRKYPDLLLKIGDPILDSLVEFEDDNKDRQVATTARARIVATVTECHQRLGTQAAHGGIDYNKAKSVVADVMDFLAQNPVSSALLDRNMDSTSPLAEHSGTVFYLSMVLGSAVRDYVMKERQRQTNASKLSGTIAMDLLPLGLGAMFMDIGMMSLSHIFAEGYQLTDEDRRAIRAHPTVGADLLPEHLPTGVKMIVRTHHENYDGSGYPNGMAGPTLHVFTRIARICDAFAAATGSRAYKGKKSPARVIWEMSVGPYHRFYDPVLMKVFSSLIQPFPIGGKVKLADGSGAVVVRYNRRDPYKPTLVLAFAPDGSRLGQGALRTLSPEELACDAPTRIVSYAGENLEYLHENPAPLPVREDDANERSEPIPFDSLLQAAYP